MFCVGHLSSVQYKVPKNENRNRQGTNTFLTFESQYNTWLLMKLMPKGVGLTSLFLVFFLSPCLVFLFFLYASTQACSCCLVRRHEADLLIIYNVKFLTQHFRLSQPYWVWICAFGQTPGEDCCLCHDMRLPLAIFAGRHHISGTLVPSAGKRSCTRHPLLFAHV